MPIENIIPNLYNKVFVYSKENRCIYDDRYVTEVKINTHGTKYTLNAGWQVDEVYVSKEKSTLIKRLLQMEESRHLSEINLIQNLCAE